MVVRQCNAQFRCCLFQQGGCLGHHLGRAFVHGDVGDPEPSFFTEVGRKGVKEWCPHFPERRCARIRPDIDILSRYIIPVVKHVVPRKHRITVDVFPDSQIEHERHPAVENRKVVFPGTVGQTSPFDHVGISILALVVPGILVECGGDDFLPGLGQHLHRRAHPLEMLIAPQRHGFDTRYGRRVLPQVEVIGPFRRCGQRPLRDVEMQGQCPVEARSRDPDRSRIATGHRIAGNRHGDPDRAGRAGRDVKRGDFVEQVGFEVSRITLRTIPTRALRQEAVADDILHEASPGNIPERCSGCGLEVADPALQSADRIGRRNDDLRRDFLAAPPCECV